MFINRDVLYNDLFNLGLNIPLTNTLADDQSNTIDPTVTQYQSGIKNNN